MKGSLFFLHIPRTGGTSLRQYLRSQFLASKICPADNWKELFAIPQKELSQYKLYQGHFEYNLWELLDKKPVIVTFLRDPVERVVSWYRYIRSNPALPRSDKFQRLSLLQLIDEPVERKEIENFQTNMLSNDVNLPTVYRRATGSFPTLPMRFRNRNFSIDLELALERLEQIEVVGLTEKYEQSLMLLSKATDWPAPAAPPHVNKSSQTGAEIEPRALEIIAELNQLDSALYSAAQKLFDSRLKLAGL